VKIDVKISGNQAIINRLRELSSQAVSVVADEVEATTMDIHRDAVARVPVDTGRLKGSLTPVVLKQGEKVTGEVGTNVEYAPYVEFGTGGKVNIPQGLETYAARFKGKGERQVNLPARPYLFNSFFENVPKMMARIQKGIASIVK
jgi:phage gpG-like protein